MLWISKLARGNYKLWFDNTEILFWVREEEMTLELDLNNSWYGMHFQHRNGFGLRRDIHIIYYYFKSRVWVWIAEKTNRLVLSKAEHTRIFDSSQPRKKNSCSHTYALITEWLIFHLVVNVYLILAWMQPVQTLYSVLYNYSFRTIVDRISLVILILNCLY